jgi:hypothetical protein
MNRNQLDRLVVSGGIRPVKRTMVRRTMARRAPMVYSRNRFAVMFWLTLATILAAMLLGRLGVI